MSVDSGALLVLANGVQIPKVGFGTFKAKGTEASNAVCWAIMSGIRHIDTATIYKNHEEVIEGMRMSGLPREQLFITSKISPYQMGNDATQDTWQSLAPLSPDLLLIHWPGVSRVAPTSPLNYQKRLETWRILEEWYQKGRVRAIGVSNFTAKHLQQLVDVALVPPMVNQIEVHPRYPQTQLRQMCARMGIAVVAYASLGCGALLQHPSVLAIAHQYGKSAAQVLLRWGLQQGCAVIPKSVREDRIAEFAPAQLLSWQLEEEDVATLDSLEDGNKFCWDPKDVV